MNRKLNISVFLRIIALVIIGLTVSVSAFEYTIQDNIERRYAEIEDLSGEKNQETDNENQFFIPDYQATLSTFQLHIDQVPRIQICIPEINNKRTWSPDYFIFPESEFFKTLFQHIISPNAP